MRRRKRECAQSPRREAEAAARQTAVDYVDEARRRGTPAGATARRLNTPARTLRHWRFVGGRRKEAGGQAQPARRGRPCKTAPPETLAEVRRFLREVSGPAVGLEAMRALFPHVDRCLLEDQLRRYRRVWRRRYRETGFSLDWKQAGAVWAIDFSEPQWLIDGLFPQLFAVRDLASHRQLAWIPVTGATAEQAIAVSAELFEKHGAPLVIKCDNGSAFIAGEFQAFLAKRGVLPLYSPPRRPQYNGAVERANGVLKTYTQQHAAAERHPFRWTSDDVEAARRLSNRLSRPWGHRGPTPDEAWQARQPIGDEQRQAFQAAVAKAQVAAREALRLPREGELRREEQAAVDRLAIQWALCGLGYLDMDRADRPRKAKRLSRAELAKRAAEAGLPSDPRVARSENESAGESGGAKETNSAVAEAKTFEAGEAHAAGEPFSVALGTSPIETTVDSKVEPPNGLTAATALASLLIAFVLILAGASSPASAAQAPSGPPLEDSMNAAQEKEQAQLAPPLAADTMRAAADDASADRSGAASPAPAHVEPAKPP